MLHKVCELLPAVEAYRRVLEVQESRHFTSVDPSIGGVKARHNLPLVYEDLGKFDLAEMHWRLALEASADFLPAYRALFGMLLKQAKLITCERLIQHWRGLPQTSLDLELLEAELNAAQRDVQGARQKFNKLIEANSVDWQALNSASQFFCEQGEPHEAEGVLERLLAVRPEDAAAHYNPAVNSIQLGKNSKALSAIQESLRLRPESAKAIALKMQLEEWRSASPE